MNTTSLTMIAVLGAVLAFLPSCKEESTTTPTPTPQASGGSTAAPPAAPPHDPPAPTPTPTQGTLAAETAALSAGFEQRASDDIKALYASGIQAVVDAGVVEHAKGMGDLAPDFTLTNQTGESVTLSELLAKGPVVLMWYRGGWCPFCNLTLRAYQERLEDFNALGATLVALTPELPDRSITTAEKAGLGYQVLSDVGNAVAREYGVVFSLTEGVKANYEQAFGLSQYNGDDKGELPLAATYVIHQDGTIRWAFLDADYRNRAEPDDVIAALERMKQDQGG